MRIFYWPSEPSEHWTEVPEEGDLAGFASEFGPTGIVNIVAGKSQERDDICATVRASGRGSKDLFGSTRHLGEHAGRPMKRHPHQSFLREYCSLVRVRIGLGAIVAADDRSQRSDYRALKKRPLLTTPASGMPSTDAGVISQKWLRRSFVVLVCMAIVYVGVTSWTGRAGWTSALKAISARDVLILIGLITVGLLIRAARWHYYITLLGWNVPISHSVMTFVASVALTATPGKTGEVVKAALLRTRHNVSLSQGAAVLLIERLGDLLAVIVLASGGLTVFTDLKIYFLASVALISAVLLLILHPRASQSVLDRAIRVSRLRKMVLRVTNIVDAVRRLLRPGPVVVGGILALAAWASEAFAFHFLIGLLGVHCPPLISFSIFGLSTLAGAVSMLPGGLGGVEVVMAFLLTHLAAPTSVATIAVVIFRLCTIWLFSLVGAAFMFGWILFVSKLSPSRKMAGAT
jgi:glycosyltransferase 2 family protein